MEKIKEGPHTGCRHQTSWNLLGRILNGWRKKTVLSHDDDDDDDDVLINNF